MPQEATVRTTRVGYERTSTRGRGERLSRAPMGKIGGAASGCFQWWRIPSMASMSSDGRHLGADLATPRLASARSGPLSTPRWLSQVSPPPPPVPALLPQPGPRHCGRAGTTSRAPRHASGEEGAERYAEEPAVGAAPLCDNASNRHLGFRTCSDTESPLIHPI